MFAYSVLMTFASFEIFLIKNSPLNVILMTDHRSPSHHACGRKRTTEEFRGSRHHDLPVVDAMIRGVIISCEAVLFLTVFQLPSSF